MSRKDRATQLQTSAADADLTPAERQAAGHGGSYAVDPAGSVTLVDAPKGDGRVWQQDANAPKHYATQADADAAAAAAAGGQAAVE